MQYGICNLSIVPVRLQPEDATEMVTQLLYGEHFKILEEREKWSRIRIASDSCEGWVDKRQYLKIEETAFYELNDSKPCYSADLIEYLIDENSNLTAITLGAVLNYVRF